MNTESLNREKGESVYDYLKRVCVSVGLDPEKYLIKDEDMPKQSHTLNDCWAAFEKWLYNQPKSATGARYKVDVWGAWQAAWNQRPSEISGNDFLTETQIPRALALLEKIYPLPENEENEEADILYSALLDARYALRGLPKREYVLVKDIDAEIAIAEGIQMIPKNFSYEEYGTPVLKHLKSLGYIVIKKPDIEGGS